MAEMRPFWKTTDDSETTALKQALSEKNIAPALEQAVPTLTKLPIKDDLYAEYTIKDGMLLYHFYNVKRKEIFESALKAMEDAPAAEQNRLGVEANAALEKHPWPLEFGENLSSVFVEHFRQPLLKVEYYLEVDSWSVMLPEPELPGSRAKTHLEAIAPFIASKCVG